MSICPNCYTIHNLPKYCSKRCAHAASARTRKIQHHLKRGAIPICSLCHTPKTSGDYSSYCGPICAVEGSKIQVMRSINSLLRHDIYNDYQPRLNILEGRIATRYLRENPHIRAKCEPVETILRSGDKVLTHYLLCHRYPWDYEAQLAPV